MNELTKNPTLQEKRVRLLESAKSIDETALSAAVLFDGADGSFEKELAVAQAVVEMRAMLTPEVMQPVMALMNTPLGFVTDCDPSKETWDAKSNGYTRKQPYPVEVVRECFIESKLRGFRTCGNEWNIIAGRFYAAQNGLRRKVKAYPGLNNLEWSIDPPTMSADGTSAKITCRASWYLNGTAGDIGKRPDDPCVFLVRVNKAMGADAIGGKAERKMFRKIYERISGQAIADGEAGEDAQVVEIKPTAVKINIVKPELETKPDDGDLGPQVGKYAAGLQEIVEAQGVSFQQFQRAANLPECGSWLDVPEETAKQLAANPKQLAAIIKAAKGV